jgi:hypothetical protein
MPLDTAARTSVGDIVGKTVVSMGTGLYSFIYILGEVEEREPDGTTLR